MPFTRALFERDGARHQTVTDPSAVPGNRALGALSQNSRHYSHDLPTEAAIVASQLEPHFPVRYKNARGRVAHECILDPRTYQRSCRVTVDDIAKRLVDYGFHAPTISFPVGGRGWR
jgi:hypothetical protein